MAKTDSPNSSPEEVEKIQIELATLAYFLYTTPQAKHLLFEAKAGQHFLKNKTDCKHPTLSASQHSSCGSNL